MEAEEGTTLEDVFLRSPPNLDRQLPNRLPETPETLRPDKTDESMTTEGSRTDDASETSAAHCPGRTPPSLADDEGEHNAVVGACVRGHHAASVLDRRVFGAYLAGGFVAGSETEPPIEWARVAFVYGWIFVVGFGGYRAYAVALRPDNLDGLLTTAVSHRDLISGLLLTELALWSAFFLTVGGALLGRVRRRCRLTTHDPRPVAHIVSLTCDRDPSRFHHRTLGVRNAGVRSRLLSRLRTLFRPARYRVLRADLHERVCVSPGTDLSSALADADRLVRGSAALGLGVGASPFRAIGAVGFTGVFVVVAVVPVPTFRVALVR